MLRSILLSFAFLLGACGKNSSSGLKIVGGDKVNVELNTAPERLPFMAAIQIVPTRSTIIPAFKVNVCSGFRNGTRLLITSARCLRKNMDFLTDEDNRRLDQAIGPNPTRDTMKWVNIPKMNLLYASGSAFITKSAVYFHPDYRENCAKDLLCPDIAIIMLPEELTKTDAYRDGTDPAIVDKHFDRVDTRAPLIAAGFGCFSDSTDIGNCSHSSVYEGNTHFDQDWANVGFNTLSYSVGRINSFVPFVDFAKEIDLKLKPSEHYLHAKPEVDDELEKTAYFASGDAGAPIFSVNNFPQEIQPGDFADATVEAMVVHAPEQNKKAGRYVNVALNLGHHEVLSFIRAMSAFDSAKAIGPIPAADGSFACNLQTIDPFSIPNHPQLEVPDSYFTPFFDSRLKTNIKEIKDKDYAKALATCFQTVFKKLDDLNKKHPDPKAWPQDIAAKISAYEYANYMNFEILELLLEWQVTNEKIAADNLKIAHEEARNILWKVLDVAGDVVTDPEFLLDVATDTLPVVSQIKDVTVAVTGYNFATGEEEAGWVRDLALVTLVAPPALKATGKMLRRIESGGKIAAKIAKYSHNVGRLTKRVQAIGERMKNMPDQIHIVQKAHEMGIRSVAAVRSFAKIGQAFAPVCAIFSRIGAAPSVWDRYKSFSPFDLLIPRAYAGPEEEAKCAADVLSVLQAAKTKVANIDAFLIGGKHTDDLAKVVDSSMKSGFKSQDEIGKIIAGSALLPKDGAEKIVDGVWKSNNKIIGGHSAKLRKDPAYTLTELGRNTDGTTKVNLVKNGPNGPSQVKPNHTFYPEDWDDDKILNTTRFTSQTPPVAKDIVDGELLHTYHRYKDPKSGVMVDVIVSHKQQKITSSYPMGDRRELPGNFTRVAPDPE